MTIVSIREEKITSEETAVRVHQACLSAERTKVVAYGVGGSEDATLWVEGQGKAPSVTPGQTFIQDPGEVSKFAASAHLPAIPLPHRPVPGMSSVTSYH
ncbi:hypothetical protein E2C01_048890 [Portunus trituberculatus]|uniref:Uncharacterized protein n=1 Tax=Portunus trituberculatus TaxID=210409 RepID=A0A5B7G488_PORTR|nr:hypothetical protein [Portunus trituberculatus]